MLSESNERTELSSMSQRSRVRDQGGAQSNFQEISPLLERESSKIDLPLHATPWLRPVSERYNQDYGASSDIIRIMELHQILKPEIGPSRPINTKSAWGLFLTRCFCFWFRDHAIIYEYKNVYVWKNVQSEKISQKCLLYPNPSCRRSSIEPQGKYIFWSLRGGTL